MLLAPSSDDVTVAVHDLGGAPVDAGATPVVLAHATGFCGPVFAPLAGRLHHVHAWAPDLRGHGASTTPGDHDFAWSGWADDVLATLDVLGLPEPDRKRPIGFGHSGGGAALLLAEQRRPGTFAALYLFEPVVMPPDAWTRLGGNPLAAGARLRRSTFPSREAAYENFASKPPMDVFDAAALQGYIDGGFVDQPDGSVRLACRPEDEARMYEMSRHSGAHEVLPSITCPVVVARGRIDESSGPSPWAAATAAALPHGRLEAFDQLGHFGPMEDPGAIASSLQSIIDGD
jgi:pimeloyl-ACP methyl ester carboxylesterase